MAQKMLPLAEVLGALDRRDKKYYENLSDTDKKAFTPYILLRYASNVDADQFLTEHYLTATNEVVNVNYWALTKHPKLQWMLFSMVGAYKKQRHPWLKSNNKKIKQTEMHVALLELFPAAKLDELELLEQVLDKNTVTKFLHERNEHNKKQR